MHPHTRSTAMGCMSSAFGGLILNPFKQFVSIVLYVLLAVSSPTPTAADLFCGDVRLKSDVTLTLSPSKTSFADDEPILVDVTLMNKKRKKSAHVLDWVVPCKDTKDVTSPKTPTEMSFFAINAAGGYVAKYIGAVYKQAKPAVKDYKMLRLGENVLRTINLGKYYEFASASNDNSYKIKYSMTSMELSDPNASTNSSALEGLESNTITIKVDARNVPTRALCKQKLQSMNNFCNCDTTRQNLLVKARSRAVNAANGALSVIDSVGQVANAQNCPRYKEWFGNYDPNRHNELRSGYLISRNRLSSASITFDCGCTL
jgi:hypothetical protein